MIVEMKKEVNLSKLHDELLRNGVVDSSSYFGSDYFVAKDGADIGLIQQIIDLHDSTPLHSPKTDIELLKERLEATEQALLQIMIEGTL